MHIGPLRQQLMTLRSVIPQVDDIRGSPLTVGTLEEIIDEK
jgi:hypothetical protein